MKPTRVLATLLISFITLTFVLGQKPEIASISPVSGQAGDVITISGNGFSTNTADLVVFFSYASGRVLTATNNLIEVVVPAGAGLGSISVTNKVSGLIGYSSKHFLLSYSGKALDPTLLIDTLEYTTAGNIFDLCLCDFDLDGLVDIATTNTDLSANNFKVFRNITVDNKMEFTLLNNFEFGIDGPSQDITCADLNGDGLSEVILSRIDLAGSNLVTILQNTSTPGNIKFGPDELVSVNVDFQIRRIAVRDLTGNGKPELILTNQFNNIAAILVNNSTPTDVVIVDANLEGALGGSPSSFGIDIEDLNQNGRPDIVINPFLEQNIILLENTSIDNVLSFSTRSPVEITVPGNLNTLIATDFDMDQKLDVLTTNFQPQGFLNIMLNSTPNIGDPIAFAAPDTLQSNNDPWGFDIADLNGDGLPDIVATSLTSNNLRVYENNSTPGNIVIGTRANISTGTQTSRNIKIGDLNDDGKPDIAYSAISNFGLKIIKNKNCFVPEILGDNSITVCGGQTVRINASPAKAVKYDWKIDNVTDQDSVISFYDFTADGAGHTITVTAVGEGGSCTEVSNSLTILFDPATTPTTPTLTDPQPVCVGDDATLMVPTDPTPGATYEWTGPNGFTSAVQNPVITSVIPENAGRYGVVVTAGNCSSDEATLLLEVIPSPTVSITPADTTLICQGTSLQFSVDAQPGFNIQWNLNDTPIPGATNATHLATAVGKYTATFTATAASCEKTTNPAVLESVTPPVADFTFTGSCSNSPTVFTDASVIDPNATATYSWDFGDMTPVSNAQNPVHTYTTDSTYTVTQTVNYGITGCSDTKMSSVIIADAQIISITFDRTNPEICAGDSITLTANGTFNSTLWSTGATTQDIIVTTGGTYSVTGTDANGCTSTDSLAVALLPTPVLVVTASDTVILAGESVDLNATGADFYTWSPTDFLDDPTASNPVSTPDSTIVYTVTGISMLGCRATAQITITVVETDGPLLIAPTIFSPNGDGIDDLWVVGNIQNFPNCTMMIFNRQGNKVFERMPYYNNEWDGTSLNGDLPEGAYYFILKCENSVVKTGSVVVVR